MYLLYLDDAGSPANASEDYFVLDGICVFESQADWFTRELDKLALGLPSDTPPADVEFHASTIFSRRQPPWNTLSAPEARGVIKSVLGIVHDSYDSARLFACAIEKRSFPGQDPVELAFEDLCKRFDLFLTRLRQDGDRQRGILILDRTVRETSLQRLSREFRTVGARWGGLHNLVDTPMFVDSRASRLVQVADHIAYSVFRRYNAGDISCFDLIASRFDSVDHVIHGLVHKHSGRFTCTCPACLSRRLKPPLAE